jgi:hypothetical protein
MIHSAAGRNINWRVQDPVQQADGEASRLPTGAADEHAG